MSLRKVQIEHFVRFGFGTDDADEVLLFFPRPRVQFWNQRQHERKILEGGFLQWSPPREADIKHPPERATRALAHEVGVSAEIARHPPIDSQSDVARREAIPCSDFSAG